MENNLAENIRSYRKSLGFTQEQLAERLGITLATVSKWERGGSEPDLARIMDLAELFHVSVDALIGFSMRGTDADTEADRIEALNDIPVERTAEEYEAALKKFPNSFRIVCGAALAYERIGVVYRREKEVKRALELFRHAIDLISQNRNPDINEVLLRNEIAGCYSALKDHKKAIEEYKKNNLSGSNNARIGCLITLCEKKPEEGIKYTEKAFFGDISNMVTTMAGYTDYYIMTKRYEQGIRATKWVTRFLESLKDEPDRLAYVDKLIPLYYMGMAVLQHGMGNEEASEKSLRTAIRIAAEFDAAPVTTMKNMILLNDPEKQSVYDDTGPTAIDGLVSSLEDIRDFVPDDFRNKIIHKIEAVKQSEGPFFPDSGKTIYVKGEDTL